MYTSGIGRIRRPRRGPRTGNRSSGRVAQVEGSRSTGACDDGITASVFTRRSKGKARVSGAGSGGKSGAGHAREVLAGRDLLNVAAGYVEPRLGNSNDVVLQIVHNVRAAQESITEKVGCASFGGLQAPLAEDGAGSVGKGAAGIRRDGEDKLRQRNADDRTSDATETKLNCCLGVSKRARDEIGATGGKSADTADDGVGDSRRKVGQSSTADNTLVIFSTLRKHHERTYRE